MASLKGKNALVTGASSGIGYEFAKYLAHLGANIIIVARRKARLEQLMKEIREKNKVKVEIITIDLSARESPDSLFRKIKRQKINVDILVNNAGFGIHTYFHSSSWEENQSMLDLLVMNLVHLTRLFIPDMIERKFGYILNVSSTGAFQPTPTYAVYAAAKSFVYNFSLALNHEIKNTGVSCTTICPGVTITEFQEKAGHTARTFFTKLSPMTAGSVAKIGIKAMLKGKRYVVPGIINKINSFAARHLPRSIITGLAASAMGKPKEK